MILRRSLSLQRRPLFQTFENRLLRILRKRETPAVSRGIPVYAPSSPVAVGASRPTRNALARRSHGRQGAARERRRKGQAVWVRSSCNRQRGVPAVETNGRGNWTVVDSSISWERRNKARARAYQSTGVLGVAPRRRDAYSVEEGNVRLGILSNGQ